MPKRSHETGQGEKAGNLSILVMGGPRGGTDEARMALLAKKMQQLFDQKAGYQAHRPGEARKHIH